MARGPWTPEARARHALMRAAAAVREAAALVPWVAAAPVLAHLEADIARAWKDADDRVRAHRTAMQREKRRRARVARLGEAREAADRMESAVRAVLG